MSDRNDGGAAFPCSGFYGGDDGPAENDTVPQAGMSLRDYFAAAALQGYRAGKHINAGAYPSETKLWSSEGVARHAYQDADAMLAEREKKA